MTTRYDLQQHLKDTHRYAGNIDGIWGRLTEAGVLLMLTDGPDTPLSTQDLIDSSIRLNCPVAHIRAVIDVEANGSGFFAGRPLILPEPHRFSKATKGVFDAKYPNVSYPKWGTRPYPRTQDARYDVLLQMIRLDVDAGFGSASYGKFQIMGENFKLCGYKSSMLFAEAMARDEKTQLRAFEAFLRTTGLIGPLQRGEWASFARGYNGSAYAKNQYDTKLAKAAAKYKTS